MECAFKTVEVDNDTYFEIATICKQDEDFS